MWIARACRSRAAPFARSPTMRRACWSASGPKPPADVAFADVLVVVPGTWIVFDHFTHKITLIGFARDAAEGAAIEGRLDEYIARLLGARATIPGNVRSKGAVNASLDEAGFLERVARAETFHLRRRRLPTAVGHRYSCELDGDAVRFLPATAHAQSLAVYVFPRNGRACGVRRVAGISRSPRRRPRAVASARGHAAARRAIRPKTMRSPRNCWPIRRSAPNT